MGPEVAARRTHYVIYAVTLREHAGVVKIGMTTNWHSRRREYDVWNFANGDGMRECAVYRITEEYVDLRDIERACLAGMGFHCPMFRGNEWFIGDIETAKLVIEDVLNTAGVSFSLGMPIKR